MAKKSIVVTLYGKGESALKAQVSLFDIDKNYHSNNESVTNYCDNINNLELSHGEWIQAFEVAENERFDIIKKRIVNLNEILLLSDRAVQKLIREEKDRHLAIALFDTSNEVKEKIFKNMTKRAADMIKTDINFMGPCTAAEIKEAQKKVIDTISHLMESGEMTFIEDGADVFMA
jgi:flagellar motor switch protein FliG